MDVSSLISLHVLTDALKLIVVIRGLTKISNFVIILTSFVKHLINNILSFELVLSFCEEASYGTIKDKLLILFSKKSTVTGGMRAFSSS